MNRYLEKIAARISRSKRLGLASIARSSVRKNKHLKRSIGRGRRSFRECLDLVMAAK